MPRGRALSVRAGRGSLVRTMAVTRKPKIQASEVEVGNRTLDNVLIDLAERIKAYGELSAERARQADERMRRLDERFAEIAEQSARNEELVTIALQTISAVSQDLRALAQRTDDRLVTLEKAVAAE